MPPNPQALNSITASMCISNQKGYRPISSLRFLFDSGKYTDKLSSFSPFAPTILFL